MIHVKLYRLKNVNMRNILYPFTIFSIFILEYFKTNCIVKSMGVKYFRDKMDMDMMV